MTRRPDHLSTLTSACPSVSHPAASYVELDTATDLRGPNKNTCFSEYLHSEYLTANFLQSFVLYKVVFLHFLAQGLELVTFKNEKHEEGTTVPHRTTVPYRPTVQQRTIVPHRTTLVRTTAVTHKNNWR